MVFCNSIDVDVLKNILKCHNPYFNRWFSAIGRLWEVESNMRKGHNPYFNRWFSAILHGIMQFLKICMSQSLF